MSDEQDPSARTEPVPVVRLAAPGTDRREGLFAILTAVGGLAVGIGSLLPWLTVSSANTGTISFVGTTGDGRITLIVGAVILGLAALRMLRPGTPALVQRLSILLGAATALFGVWRAVDIGGVTDEIGSVGVTVTVGIGLYVVILGGALAAVGGVVVSRARV